MAHAIRLLNEDLGFKTKKVNLALTPEEAYALMALVGVVNGDTDGPRGYTNNIYEALRESGVKDPNVGCKYCFTNTEQKIKDKEFLDRIKKLDNSN